VVRKDEFDGYYVQSDFWELTRDSALGGKFLGMRGHSVIGVCPHHRRDEYTGLRAYLPYRWSGAPQLEIVSNENSIQINGGATGDVEFLAIDLSKPGARESLARVNSAQHALAVLATSQEELALACRFVGQTGRTAYQLCLGLYGFSPRLETVPDNVDTLVLAHCDLERLGDGSALASVRHLDILKCRNLDVSALRQAARLETLELHEPIYPRNYHVLSELRQLRQLKIAFPTPEEGTIQHVAKLDGLESLHLGLVSADEEGLAALRGLANLAILRVTIMYGFCDFAFLGQLAKLRVLEVECRGPGSYQTIPPMENLEVFAIRDSFRLRELDVLSELPRLKYLNVYETGILPNRKLRGRIEHVISDPTLVSKKVSRNGLPE